MPANSGSVLSPSRPAIEQQVERVASSSGFQHSEALCLLLRYLVTHTLDRPEEGVKEYQIAVDTLGRSESFDPKIDSVVRVQTSRLRTKLAEYYAGPGAHDPVVIDLPKGTYSPSFCLREPPAPEVFPVVQPAPAVLQEVPVERRKPFWNGMNVLRLLILVLLATAIVLLLWVPPRNRAAVAKSNQPLSVFWQSFLDSDAEPLVVFSNAEFVGRPETGLRYFTPGSDAPDLIFDHYTGVGEVISIHELDQVFARLNRRLQLKRGRLLTWDDAQNRNLVFLGSPSENLALRELPLWREFRFQTMDGPPRKGDLGIVNLHPAAGESPVYFGSKELPITEDYALVELVKGASPAQSVLLLAGTTTFGTEGAVDFVCNEDRVREILGRVRTTNGSLAPFSALLRINISRGVPIASTLVALRTR